MHTENITSLAIQITDTFKIFKFSNEVRLLYEKCLFGNSRIWCLRLLLYEWHTNGFFIKRPKGTKISNYLPVHSRSYSQSTHQHVQATLQHQKICMRYTTCSIHIKYERKRIKKLMFSSIFFALCRWHDVDFFFHLCLELNRYKNHLLRSVGSVFIR